MTTLFDSLLTEKRLEGQLETVKFADITQAQGYLCKKEVSGQLKLSQLCNWSHSNYLDFGEFNVTLKCPLCSYSESSPKYGTSTNSYAELLCKHLFTSHRPFIGICFAQKIKD